MNLRSLPASPDEVHHVAKQPRMPAKMRITYLVTRMLTRIAPRRWE
jgi:hypothetical protein